MLTTDLALKIVHDSFESLQRSGTIEKEVAINTDTVLLGSGSFLDSIEFVTFVSEVEERLEDETGDVNFIVLNDIAEFNINRPELTVEIFAQYLVKLVTTA